MEIGLLFLILLAKASKLFQSPSSAAADAQKKAADAAAAAAAAAAAGDHAGAQEKAKEAAAHAASAQQLTRIAKTPAPWPQALPPDLPPFPSGWRPASPVTSAMVTRAFQLLSELWSHGEGTWKPEKTGDRWVVYQARMTQKPDGSIVRGVVVFTASSQAPAAQAFVRQPVVTPGEALPAQGGTVPASQTTTHATLARGSKGPSVVWLQQHLGIPADGSFGPGTEAAVIAYQRRHGLTPDGVVGPATWNSFGGSSAQAA